MEKELRSESFIVEPMAGFSNTPQFGSLDNLAGYDIKKGKKKAVNKVDAHPSPGIEELYDGQDYLNLLGEDDL